MFPEPLKASHNKVFGSFGVSHCAKKKKRGKKEEPTV